jgi:CBS domain-containing protein
MTSNPVSLRETATAREAAYFLTERGISAAPVINEAGIPIGVLSQTDLVIHDRETPNAFTNHEAYVGEFLEFAPVRDETRGICNEFKVDLIDDKAIVGDLMTPTVFSVPLDAPSNQVVKVMLALRVHRLFVVDDGGALVGVVTATDVLRCLESKPDADA